MNLESRMAVNPFSKSGDLREPDDVEEVKLGDTFVEKAIKSYKNIDFDERDFDKIDKQISSLEKIVLNPNQINVFLQVIIEKESKQKIMHWGTGLYLSKLIQDSYNAGNNDFTLNTGDTQINCLGYKIKGSKKKQIIQIKINGNVGNWCGLNTQNSTFNIKGNVGDECGKKARHSTFTIEGDVGGSCGDLVKYSVFKIKGCAGEKCGSCAIYSMFNVEGNVGDECGEYVKNTI